MPCTVPGVGAGQYQVSEEVRVKDCAVAAVILNWNCLAETQACISSLLAAHLPPEKIFVVDNGSKERIDTLRSDARIDLIELPRNFGFCGGVNVGIKAALAARCTHVWLVNADVRVDDDTLQELMAAVDANPGAGALSPVIYFADDRRRVQHAASYINRATGVHREDEALGSDRFITSSQDKGGETLMLWGTALLLSAGCIQKVGLFDERFFAYGEDSDYCLRVKHAGFDAVVATASRVFHGNPTTGRRGPHYYYYTSRNAFLFNFKSFPLSVAIRLTYWHLARLRKLYAAMKKDSVPQATALRLGVLHGICRVWGEYRP
jgi:GT2 family glycosyltransferase